MRLKKNKQRSNLFPGRIIFALCLICAIFSGSTFAKKLSEYRNNVNYARDLTLQLL